MNAGRQILSSGNSKRNLKDAVPKSNEVNALKKRNEKNYIKGNLNKVVFESKPKDAESQAGAA